MFAMFLFAYQSNQEFHTNSSSHRNSLMDFATGIPSSISPDRLDRRALEIHPAADTSIAAEVAGIQWCFKCSLYCLGYLLICSQE